MAVSAQTLGGTTVVSVTGRIEHPNAEAFRAEFLPVVDQAIARTRGAVLDLAGLDYISSAGLRVLMIAAQGAKAKGGKLAATALNPVVKEIFTISRFSFVIPCADTLDDAIAKVLP